MMEVVMTIGSYKTCKAPQSNHHHQQTNTQMPDALPVTQPTVSALKGESITLHRLVHPELTWRSSILVLTTKGSCLP